MSELSFDKDSLYGRFSGDESVVKEVVEAYLEEQPELCHALTEALRENDGELVRRAIHALKGSLLNVCANKASELAEELELLARVGDARSDCDYNSLFTAIDKANQEIIALFKLLSA